MKKFQHWLLASIVLIGFVVTGNLYTQAQQTAQGEVQLEIQAGNSCCVYGTSLAFGEKDINFGVTEFTGDFLSYHGTTTWGCRDLLGTETGRAMYIAMSGDMENQNGNKIASGNVKISFDETQLVGGDCVLYNNSGIDVPLNDSVALVEKDGNVFANYGKICELGTTNVKLKVVTNTGQAPGNYVGTLVIDLPSFVNSTCDGLLEGTFYDAETDGLFYIGNMGSAGITANSGTFDYKPGEEITFKIGNLTLGNPVTPATNGSVFVTDLFGLARTEITDPNVIEVATLLQGLDDDNNPDNGILISSDIAATFTESGNVTGLDVSAKLLELERVVPTTTDVVQHLANTASEKLSTEIDINHTWIATAVSSNQHDDSGIGIVGDELGNLYTVGHFGQSNVLFGNTTLTSTSRRNVYVSKLDKAGNWLRASKGTVGPDDWIYAYSIDIDPFGNSYVIGDFYGTATFGSITLTSSGTDQNMYVGKLDSNGNWLRVTKGWIEENGVESYKISVDGSGNSYVIGFFYGTGFFDDIVVNTNGYYANMFVGKIDTNGNWLQITIAGSDNGLVEPNGLTVDGSGNSYIVGGFRGTGFFGEHILSNVGVTEKDLFVGKIDANGDWLRVRGGGGTNRDEGYGISLDLLGNIYIVGSFRGTGVFGETSINSSDGSYTVVGKLDIDGNWIRANKGGGSVLRSTDPISLDGNGNAYVFGSFQGTGIFGSIEVQTVFGSYHSDTYLAKINANGVWTDVSVLEGFSQKDSFIDSYGNIAIIGGIGQEIILGKRNILPVGIAVYKMVDRNKKERMKYKNIIER